VISTPCLLDPAAEELKLRDISGGVAVARAARTLLGERFDSESFMYVLMRAYSVDFHAARDAARWQGFGESPRALSDADLEVLLAPWLATR
jgi:hypothetical protein